MFFKLYSSRIRLFLSLLLYSTDTLDELANLSQKSKDFGQQKLHQISKIHKVRLGYLSSCLYETIFACLILSNENCILSHYMFVCRLIQKQNSISKTKSFVFGEIYWIR